MFRLGPRLRRAGVLLQLARNQPQSREGRAVPRPANSVQQPTLHHRIRVWYGNAGKLPAGCVRSGPAAYRIRIHSPCIRTHKTPGPGCVNPPTGASFYPIYTAGTAADGSCVWQLGGIYIPGTTNTFGGTSTSEYGPILQLFYPDTGGITTYLFEDFHNGLSNNPCPASA